MALPYSDATTGKAATEEMRRILQGFGAASFGVMENFEDGVLTVQFTYRGVPVQIQASWKGYAAAWLRQNPWNSRRKVAERVHQRRALTQGQIAVYSILRDWIKGQITAIEVGMMTFQGAFLGQIFLPTGQTVLQQLEASDTLPRLTGPGA